MLPDGWRKYSAYGKIPCKRAANMFMPLLGKEELRIKTWRCLAQKNGVRVGPREPSEETASLSLKAVSHCHAMPISGVRRQKGSQETRRSALSEARDGNETQTPGGANAGRLGLSHEDPRRVRGASLSRPGTAASRQVRCSGLGAPPAPAPLRGHVAWAPAGQCRGPP